jgi:hypothetical protein
MLQKFIDEKEKIRMMNERQRQEDEEKFRKKSKELESRKRDLDRKETELNMRKRDLDSREKDFIRLEQKHTSLKIDRLVPHHIHSSMNRDQLVLDKLSPTPPQLSIYDGKTEWKPYITQFGHIAQQYSWTESEKLNKLVECLKDQALHFFSSCSEVVQDNFILLCQQMKEKFDHKVPPHIIRKQLQEIKQQEGETVDEFAERIEGMATAGYEGMPDDFISAVTIDKFLWGCNENNAALVTFNKDPKTLNEAIQFMKSIINSQKTIGEVK